VSLFVEPANRAPEKGLRAAHSSDFQHGHRYCFNRARYSLAATLGFVVVAIGLQAPIVTVLAFVQCFSSRSPSSR